MITILTTGGTIEGLEYNDKDKILLKHISTIPELLKQGNITEEYEIKELFSKDSKFISPKDHQNILSVCQETEGSIIITHGTATMVETAKFLTQSNLSKTIVLTGSMILGTEVNSDALFNLGAAFTAAQTLPQGIYVAMNGQIFAANNVKKNTEKKVFENEF